MKVQRAHGIPEISRDEMTAEALALAFDASTNLGKRAVIDAIAATMNSLGNPLERIWIEDANCSRRTYKAEQALAVLGDPADFRYLWAIPASERGNSKSRWLTAVAINNIALNCASLFFALPQGPAKPFAPHVTLLGLLAQAGIVPQYGFGYSRGYGSPDYFAVDYVYKSGIRAIGQADWVRRTRGLILDVFPMNVLSDIHLQQKLADASFKEWIHENTGPESLTQIGPRCFTWFVPAFRTASVSAQLRKSGLTIDRPQKSAVTVDRVAGSVAHSRSILSVSPQFRLTLPEVLPEKFEDTIL